MPYFNNGIEKIAEQIISLVDIMGENNTLRIVNNSPEIFHLGLPDRLILKDMTSFAQEVIRLKGKKSKKKFSETIELHMDNLKALLRSSPTLKKSKKEELTKALRWDDNWEEYLTKLNLSDFQLEILEAILSSKNPVSLIYIKDFFKRKKNYIKSGSSIGGSLAGITKKCRNYVIPLVVLKVEDDGGKEVYSISPNLTSNLEKFIKNSKTLSKDCH